MSLECRVGLGPSGQRLPCVRASEDHPWRVWGRAGFSSRRSRGLGGREPVSTPASQCHCLTLDSLLWKVGGHPCHPPRARARPQDHPEPLGGIEGTSGGSGWPGPRQAEGCREGTACSPSPSRALWASAQPAALPEWTFLLPAPGCRLPLSSWGCTKWPPQPSAILCVRLAGRRPGRGGGRETTVRPLPRVAWTEPSSSPRPSSALAAAALGLAPAHVLARPSGNPGPSPSPASPLAAPSLP